MQMHFTARILVALHRPTVGSGREFLEQQQLLAKSVNTICGIAVTLTDWETSYLSCMCMSVGECHFTWRKSLG